MMKTVQLKKHKNQNWKYLPSKQELNNPLVLAFGNRYLLENPTIYNEIKQIFPNGHIVFGSTSGDITAHSVDDDSISITAIEFEKSKFLIKTSNVLNSDLDSFKTGNDLIKQFPTEGLKFVYVISEGSFINGSQLTKGMNAATENNVVPV